jgi:hypothetical protein
MAKLNQIIAIEKGTKARVQSDLSDLYKVIQKPELFNGFNKTYQPNNEDDTESLPSESKRIQYTVPEVLRSAARLQSDLMTVISRKDWTNMTATGDVVLNGKTLFSGAPVSFLLFLEKTLTDFRTFVDHLPVLDESETWKVNDNTGFYETETIKTHRTKKVQKPIVLYDATPEHPAQTQLITEDVIVGYWQQVKKSGAVGRTEKNALLDRVESLLNAVKTAREGANLQEEAVVPNVPEAIFGYLLNSSPAKE